MTSISVIKSSLLYLYLYYQIWPLEKETSCFERENVSNLVKLVVLIHLQAWGFEFLWLHLKVLSKEIWIPCVRDSDPYALSWTGNYIFNNGLESFLRRFRSLALLFIYEMMDSNPLCEDSNLFSLLNFLFQISFWRFVSFIEDSDPLAFSLKSSLFPLRDLDL